MWNVRCYKNRCFYLIYTCDSVCFLMHEYTISTSEKTIATAQSRGDAAQIARELSENYMVPLMLANERGEVIASWRFGNCIYSKALQFGIPCEQELPRRKWRIKITTSGKTRLFRSTTSGWTAHEEKANEYPTRDGAGIAIGQFLNQRHPEGEITAELVPL